MSELPSPDQTGTWEPDWRLLKQTRDKAITNIPYANDDQFNECAYRAVVSEYRRQQAERGIVEVDADLLAFVLDCSEAHLPKFEYETASQEDIRRLREQAGLAAAKDQE